MPRACLDLGRVEVIAKATLNGQPLEVLWKPPFRYDVSEKIRKGVNELQIEVINLWPNRMIAAIGSATIVGYLPVIPR